MTSFQPKIRRNLFTDRVEFRCYECSQWFLPETSNAQTLCSESCRRVKDARQRLKPPPRPPDAC